MRGLDRLGARLGFSGALLGLLTALGADAPSAVLAGRVHVRRAWCWMAGWLFGPRS